jgi:hypothetical protein
MSQKAPAVAGYARLICLLIACLTSISPSISQEESARFLWGASDSQGFIAHLSLPRGLTISNAELETSAETIPLSVSPLALPVEQWLILDASLAVVNTAPAIQTAVLDFVAEANAQRQIGLIRFAQNIEMLPPTSSPSDLAAWLGDYHAISNESGCLADALNLLNEQPHEREQARQVLAIVGAYQLCTGIPLSDSPVDLLVVGAEADAAYIELAQSSGGMLYRSGLQTLRARLNELTIQWSHPVFALEGINPSLAEGVLNLTLSSGEKLSIPISYELLFLPTATPAASETATPSPTRAATEVVTAIATTLIPVATAEETEIAVLSTEMPLPTMTPEAPAPLPISNNNLIVGGGLAAGLVVIIVMILLMRGIRRPKASKEERLDNTLLFQYNDEAELDQTDIVSTREMLAQIRPTLAGRLTDEAGNVYEIHRPITTLGRNEESDIRIVNDKQISREHLRFSVRDDGGIWITRLTQNPVLLNQIVVETMLPIKNGDILQLSPSLRLKLEIVADE